MTGAAALVALVGLPGAVFVIVAAGRKWSDAAVFATGIALGVAVPLWFAVTAARSTEWLVVELATLCTVVTGASALAGLGAAAWRVRRRSARRGDQ